jgi:hypothetical protein
MKLPENVRSVSHLRTCKRTEVVPWHLVLNLVFQLHGQAQTVAEFIFLPFVFIGTSLYTFIVMFLASHVNFFYLLDLKLPAYKPIKLDPLISLPDAWDSCVALAMLTVSHSYRCNEMWRQVSIYLLIENCFSYDLRKRSCGAFRMWLSPKWNKFLHAVYRRNLQLHSSTTIGESGNCWNPM